MKIATYLLTLLCFFASCSSVLKTTQLEPYHPKQSFKEQDREFSFEDKNGVVVSVAYDGILDDNIVFDVTVDNRSDSAILFDPSRTYLFCYDTNNRLSQEALYFTNNPDSVLVNLSSDIDQIDSKLKKNSLLSVFLGLAYITAEIAMAAHDVPEFDQELLRASHLTSQIILDETRINDLNKMDNLSYTRCKVEEGIYRTSSIEPSGYHSGKLLFSIPTSPYYKIYIPIEGNVYSFRFKTIETN